jgi:uncharacterized protein (TIGR03083 family)
MVEAEHADFVSLVRRLTSEQWSAPSLCEAWSVRDVVVHAARGRKNTWATLKLWASVGFGSPHKANAKELELHRDLSTDEVTALLAAPIEPGATWEMQNQLRGLMIHQQDIRRPLRMARAIPADRIARVLDLGLTRAGSANLGSRRRARGLRLSATDIEWTAGTGADVRGPAEAILMAISGRRAALDDLSGDGKEELARRM